MAFKQTAKSKPVPDTPDKLLLDLPRRKIPDILPHQREIMRTYAAQALTSHDVALQLATGSGKTLVALLIGEWLRRKKRWRRFRSRAVLRRLLGGRRGVELDLAQARE